MSPNMILAIGGAVFIACIDIAIVIAVGCAAWCDVIDARKVDPEQQ